MYSIDLAVFLASSLLLAGTTSPVVGFRAAAPSRLGARELTEQTPRGQSGEGVDVAATRKAAENGDAKAQRSLGDMYRTGVGAPQDPAKALAWYRKAADQGNAFALGEVYANGDGVAQDYAQAFAWYRKAADLGDVAAQSAIGSLYYFGGSIFNMGKGIPRDYAQALVWFQKAAERGEPSALAGLGAMYFEGSGVPRDLVEAHKWISLAASRAVGPGAQAEKDAVNSLETLMTSRQIAEAQKRASEWRAAFERRPK